MFNKYTIELVQEKSQTGNEVKAKIYLNNSYCLGTIWNPDNELITKDDFKILFETIGNTIYGQEQKAKKEAESNSRLIEILASSGSTKHP